MIQALLIGLGLGAGLMYILDPDRGRRRRALVRDQAVRLGNSVGDLGPRGERIARDLRERAQGLAHEARSRTTKETVTDEVLVERVRAELGRVVSHPHAVIVTARDGRVTLSGLILSREADRLVDAVRRVRGVEQVEDRLEGHAQAGGIPALQGEARQSKRGL